MTTPRVIFVSYYTPNYGGYAKKLKASLQQFGLEYDLVPIIDKGSWQENVRYKPVFLREMLRKHPEAYAIVWIDADGIVLRPPDRLFRVSKDVAFYFLKWPKKFEMLSGTVYLRNNLNVMKMMDRWIEALAIASPSLTKPEQQVLQALFTKWAVVKPEYAVKTPTVSSELPPGRKVHVSLEILPQAYCQIRNFSRETSDATVIEHNQASRQFRYRGRELEQRVRYKAKAKLRRAKDRRVAKLQDRKEKRKPHLRASKYRRRKGQR